MYIMLNFNKFSMLKELTIANIGLSNAVQKDKRDVRNKFFANMLHALLTNTIRTLDCARLRGISHIR